MAKVAKKIIALSAPVAIEAAATGDDGKAKPAKFNVLAYTGGILPGALRSGDDREDVILDLAGMRNGKSLVANLDHDPAQRVGNVNAIGNDGKELNLSGNASAATAARNEVVASAADGFVWQASVEADPHRLEQVKPGTAVKVNGQEFTAPPRGGRALYVARESTLKGFAFVSHGADDNTTVSIAASADSTKGKTMKAEVKAWAESMGLDVDTLTDEQVATVEANYEGKNPAKKSKKVTAGDPFSERKLEAARCEGIRDVADKFIDRNPQDSTYINDIERMHDHAIEAGMSVQEFRNEMYESLIPLSHTVSAGRAHDQTSGRVVEAAICMAGRLASDRDLVEKHRFTDQELQAAHDRFKGNIGLRQLFFIAAQANGYRGDVSGQVTLDVQRSAFAMQAPRIKAQNWSTMDITSILSNTANKFLMEGWNAVDQTALRISTIQNVRDFKTITTVSLTDNVIYEKVGAAGEIPHGTLSELTYTNKADTYAKMLAITRQDIINDDLGALTSVPRKLGNGAMKKLNDIFWTEFLSGVSASFFASGNSNINTGVADMTIGGLTATEVIFMNQTNPDGTPLGLQPAILLVPTALKAAAIALTDPQSQLITGASATLSNVNVFRGRFRVESSPYISNSSYTGYTSTAWWMLANPSELSCIAIAALNGRVEPTIETADADFNVLGVQMRGYSDVGVNFQEYRAGVHADGGAS